MKISVRFFLTMLLLLFSVPVIAGGGKDGCKVTGSWYGYDEVGSIWWISTVDGQSASHGTLNLEIPGSANLFNGAVAITELKGQWKKTSGNTIDWTVVGFSLDDNTASHLIAKVSGTNVLDKDCDIMMITDLMLEVFPPFADIYSDTPAEIVPFLDHPGFRIKVDMPELLPE